MVVCFQKNELGLYALKPMLRSRLVFTRGTIQATTVAYSIESHLEKSQFYLKKRDSYQIEFVRSKKRIV